MNYLKGLSAFALLLALCIFMGCQNNSGGDDKEPDFPGQAKAEELSVGTWGTTPGGVSVSGTPRDEWDGFSVSFTVNSENFEGGSYQATGIPSDDGADLVWRSSGTWAFEKNGETLNLNTIYRDGDTSTPVSLNVDVDETSGEGVLSLSFSVPEQTSFAERVAGFNGNWVFTFDLQ